MAVQWGMLCATSIRCKSVFALILGCGSALCVLYAFTMLNQTPSGTQMGRRFTIVEQKVPIAKAMNTVPTATMASIRPTTIIPTTRPSSNIPTTTRASSNIPTTTRPVSVPTTVPTTLPSTTTMLTAARFAHSPARDNGSALAINMVILPFLRYGASAKATLERERDYKVCLKKNLAHPQVQYIHLLTTNATNMQATFKEFTNNSKLIISQVKSVHNAGDVFKYISQNLLGRDAMFANADIYLGDGFDKIDPAIMDKQKIMYAISRHTSPEQYTMCGNKKKDYHWNDMCKKYINSHDAFLFRLHEPLINEFFQYTNFTFPTPGTEGRVIWTFVNVLKYCVLNPCSILNTFHLHCSQLRTNQSRRHLDTKKHFLTRRPSANLYCS